MSRYRKQLAAALRMVQLYPEWPAFKVAEMLRTRHGASPASALAIAHRAVWWWQRSCQRFSRRRHLVLPGEVNGAFDNVIRAIEDSKW